MRHVARGLAAAVRTGWVVSGTPRGRSLDRLLEPPAVNGAPVVDGRAADRATSVAFAALRALQRLPGWRNTCLYRAVAECVVLRGLGMPATLRIGVARAPGAVAAHAWVECPGHRCRASDGHEASTYAALRRVPDAAA